MRPSFLSRGDGRRGKEEEREDQHERGGRLSDPFAQGTIGEFPPSLQSLVGCPKNLCPLPSPQRHPLLTLFFGEKKLTFFRPPSIPSQGPPPPPLTSLPHSTPNRVCHRAAGEERERDGSGTEGSSTAKKVHIRAIRTTHVWRKVTKKVRMSHKSIFLQHNYFPIS